MNLVGKIFVALILVMSIMFATMAIMVYATHTNWRAEIMRTKADVRGNQQVGYKERLLEMYKQNAQLEDERSKFEKQAAAEKAAKIAAIAKAEADIALLRSENANKSRDLSAKETLLTNSNAALHSAEEGLAAATAENKKLRDEIAVSQTATDNEIKRATMLADQLAVSSGQNSVLQERNQELTADVGRARDLLKSVGKTIKDPINASTIAVSGTVTQASPNNVELSIGSDDGVRVGQELDVSRGAKYLGRVRIVQATPDKAVANILNEYSQARIMRGDNVSSGIKPNNF